MAANECDIMIVPLPALLTIHSFAPNPERAVLQIVYSRSKTPVAIRRVNVVGSYATVLTSGGMMESSPVSEAILVQHFSFGWQALDALNVRCRLHDHALGARIERALMIGMPKPGADSIGMCEGLRDAGPASDVEQVRALVDGPLVPYVIVSNGWAMAQWYGAGGGMSLWQKHAGHWRLVQGGGGALGTSEMREHGVPKSDWCKFGIVDAKCH